MKVSATFHSDPKTGQVSPRMANKSALKSAGAKRSLIKKVGWRRSVVEVPAARQDSSEITPPNSRSASDTSQSTETSSVALDDFYLLKLIGKGNFGKVMLS